MSDFENHVNEGKSVSVTRKKRKKQAPATSIYTGYVVVEMWFTVK